jgi:hypothetical protein
MRWFKLEVTKNLDLLPPGVASSTALAPNERQSFAQSKDNFRKTPRALVRPLGLSRWPEARPYGETESETSRALVCTQEAGVIEHRALLRSLTDRVERKVNNHDP